MRRGSERTSRTTATSTTERRSAVRIFRSRARGRSRRSRSTSRHSRSSTWSRPDTRTTTTAAVLRERGARPRPPPGGALARRRPRAGAAARVLRRLRRPRQPPVHRALPRVARPLPWAPVQTRRHLGVDGGAHCGNRCDGSHRLDRLQGPISRHRGRHAAGPGALPPRGGRPPKRMARGPGPDGRHGCRAGAAPGTCDLGLDHLLGRGHRAAAVAAEDRKREAVTFWLRRAPLRSVRLLRGARHRRLRRRAVGAGPGTRAHSAPRGAQPRHDAERRRAARVQPRSTPGSRRARSR